jgi:hypothetical protein
MRPSPGGVVLEGREAEPAMPQLPAESTGKAAPVFSKSRRGRNGAMGSVRDEPFYLHTKHYMIFDVDFFGRQLNIIIIYSSYIQF